MGWHYNAFNESKKSWKHTADNDSELNFVKGMIKHPNLVFFCKKKTEDVLMPTFNRDKT